MSAVPNSQTQGDLAKMGWCVQCPADWPRRGIASMGLLIQDAHADDGALDDDNAPSRRVFVAAAELGASRE
jgi:hypothetical protein